MARLASLRRRARLRAKQRGQSLVELALVLPVILLVLLFAIDFGRGFYSWVILQNASRIGANYAALNPEGWEGAGSPTIKAEYAALVSKDWGTLGCPAPIDPVFTDSPADTSASGQTPDTAYDVGDSATVTLTCPFRPLTPIISAIVGNTVNLVATSEFRIRSGEVAGLDNEARIPQPSIVGPTPTPAPTATPTPAPTPVCTVTISRSPGGTNINSGVPVTFSASATGCTITAYSWNFPLGTPGTSTVAGPVVTFSTPNNTSVTVTLTAQTSVGPRTATDSFNLKK
jgi:TadE-like protein/PKD domain-containing protein